MEIWSSHGLYNDNTFLSWEASKDTCWFNYVEVLRAWTDPVIGYLSFGVLYNFLLLVPSPWIRVRVDSWPIFLVRSVQCIYGFMACSFCIMPRTPLHQTTPVTRRAKRGATVFDMRSWRHFWFKLFFRIFFHLSLASGNGNLKFTWSVQR